jgi:hypothetical protein
VRRIIKFLFIACLFAGTPALQAQTDSAFFDSLTRPLLTPADSFLRDGMPLPNVNLPLDSVFSNTPLYMPPKNSLRIINGHSTYTLNKGKLEFCIQHRFGLLSSGYKNAWGLDQSNIRIGFDYGLTRGITLGIGRSGMGKTANTYGKFSLLNTAAGSLTWLSDMALVFEKNITGLAPWYNTHRFNYTHQLIASRILLNGKLNLQLAPTIVHRNLVDSIADANDIPLLVSNFRLKLSQKISLTGEYTHIFNQRLNSQIYRSVGFGLEFWTAGHVFQLTCTNANALNEARFLTNQNGNYNKGEFRLGFNITRRW